MAKNKKIKLLIALILGSLVSIAQCENDTINPWFADFQYEPTIECDDDLLDVFPKAYDNCDTLVDIMWYEEITFGNCPSVMDITRYYRAFDDSGNQVVETQVIHIVDETPPTITGEVYVDMVEVANLDTLSFATAYDNCSSTTLNYVDTEVSGGSVIRLYMAIDDCGNMSTFEQIIHTYQTPPDDEDEGDDSGNNNRVAICHRLGNGNWITIYVAPQAVPAHLGHGDYLGPCNEPNPMIPFVLESLPDGSVKKIVKVSR